MKKGKHDGCQYFVMVGGYLHLYKGEEVQNNMLRFASLELISSDYFFGKENGSDNTHFKILGLSSIYTFCSTIRPILLTIFWETISVVQNTIIGNVQLPSVNRLINSISLERGIEKSRIIIESVFLSIESLRLSSLIRIEADDIVQTLSYIVRLIAYILRIEGCKAFLISDIVFLCDDRLLIADNIVQLVNDNVKDYKYNVLYRLQGDLLRGFKGFKSNY